MRSDEDRGAEMDALLAERVRQTHARIGPKADLELTVRPETPEATASPSRVPTVDGPPSSTPHASAQDLPRIPLARVGFDGSVGDGSAAPPDLAEIRVLGEGGMGRVLLARQRSLGRDVAVKVLHEDATGLDAYALVSEARVASVLEHPSVVPIYSLGTGDDGRPVLVMRRIEGVSWRTLLAEPAHEAWLMRDASGDHLAANVEILVQVCRALELAHERNIVHRDIKPDNVMVGRYGEVYLLDWGLAASAKTAPSSRFIVGTPSYMAPEMALGLTVDARTDVYLLGATLHRILTGRPRHEARTLEEAVAAAARSARFVYAPETPVALASLCNEATAPDPAQRPMSVRSFRERLVTFLRARNADSICRSAVASLDALVALLSAAPPGQPPTDLTLAYSLGSQARFGIRESLKILPSGEEANAASRRCFATLVDLELRAGHVEAAEALLAEIEPRDPALEARVAQARIAEREREAEEGRIRKLLQDRDPTLPPGARVAFVIVSASILSGITLLLATRQGEQFARSLVASVLVAMGGSIVGLLALRSRLKTTLNRGLMRCFLGVQFLVLLNRAFCLLDGSPPSATVRTDLIICAMALIGGATLANARMWIPAVVTVAGAIAVERRPESAISLYATTVVGALLGIAWSLWKAPETMDR